MLNALFHRFVPASVYGGQTLFPVLSNFERELATLDPAHYAIAVEHCKAALYGRLRARFEAPTAMALAIKALNVCLAKHHFRCRSSWVLSRPLGLVVDPSNMCTLTCPGCVHSAGGRQFDWPTGTLPTARFRRLLQCCGTYAVGVYFCNYGEPLLNVGTPELIRLAKAHLLWTALSTSLSVDRFDPDAYVESGLDFMVLAIDGATQPVYEYYRRRGNLQLALDNTRKLVDARRRRGRRTPVLAWEFLAFHHNAHEIACAERMARELGVDEFWVVRPFDVAWDDPNVRPADVRPRYRRLNWRSVIDPPRNWNPFPDSLDENAVARAFENPWTGPAAPDRPRGSGHTCHWLYQNLVMDATGRILPCCGAPPPDGSMVFGNVETEGVDPFNSPKYVAARSFFSDGTGASGDAPHCTRCVWDHARVNIGGREVRRYFRAVDPVLFDSRSLKLLSVW